MSRLSSLSSSMSLSQMPMAPCTVSFGWKQRHGALLSKLVDPSLPVFLLGTLIPRQQQQDSSLGRCMENATEMVKRSRVLAYDGFLIHAGSIADTQNQNDQPRLDTEPKKGKIWGTHRRLISCIQSNTPICFRMWPEVTTVHRSA